LGCRDRPIREAGDLTVEYGRYTLGIEAEGGATMTDVGKDVVVHETRSDGSTKIFLDCFNSNAPPPHRHGRLGLGDGTEGHTGAAVQCGSEHGAVTTAACRRLSHKPV
jgi:hypothetical protein